MAFTSNLWPNSMEQAYNNTQTNRYTDGPSADVSNYHQPRSSTVASNNTRNDVAIYLKNIDPHCNEMAIRHLCETWGHVNRVKKFTASTGMAWFQTMADAEIAIRKLNGGNDLQIQASFAQFKKTDANENLPDMVDHATSNSDSDNGHSDQKSNIVWSQRTIKGPFNGPNVVKLENRYEPVNASDYNKNPKFKRTDPNMDFCFNDDLRHRAQPCPNSDYGKLKFKSCPQLEQKMKNMAVSSGGCHSKSLAADDLAPDSNQLGPCSNCRSVTDKQCSRCYEFYCSVVCQRKQWPEHRFVCFLMPPLKSTGAMEKIRVYGKSKDTGNDNRIIDSNSTSNHEDNLQKYLEDNLSKTESLKSASGSEISQIVSTSPNSVTPTPPSSVTRSLPAATTKALPVIPNTTIFLTPKSNSKVIITYVVNHRKVFLRSADADAQNDYIRTQLDCVEYEKTAGHLDDLPNNADIVLAEFEGTFYRALVLSIKSSEEISVAFIDFGNKTIVAPSGLKNLSVELQNRPRHTILVTLEGLQEKMCNTEVLFELTELMDASKPVRLVFDDSSPLLPSSSVTLFNLDTGESINQMLHDRNHIKAVPLAEPPLRLADLDYVPLEGENIEIVVLENSLLSMNSLYVVRKEHLTELVENNDLFQDYCSRVNDKYTPRVHELCLVYCEAEEFWYRAVCTEVAGDGMPAVQFIDYGNNEVISIDHIRKMPKEFAYRRVSVECMLHGIKKISPNMLDVLTQRLTRNLTIFVDKADTLTLDGEEVSTIRCEELLNELRNENLLG